MDDTSDISDNIIEFPGCDKKTCRKGAFNLNVIAKKIADLKGIKGCLFLVMDCTDDVKIAWAGLSNSQKVKMLCQAIHDVYDQYPENSIK